MKEWQVIAALTLPIFYLLFSRVFLTQLTDGHVVW
jgi:hypothetical protein